jgi:hypothetical protein
VFLASKTNPRMTAWNALPEADRLAKQKEGIAAWKAWVEKNQPSIVAMGGPLGKTKKVSQRGIEDTSNEMGAFMVVRGDSHEAVAKLFEGHPHFTMFFPVPAKLGAVNPDAVHDHIRGCPEQVGSNRVIATRRQPMCLTVQRSFIDFSSVSPGPKVRFGSIAPYLAKAKTPVCPLCSVSDHSAAEVVCLRSANSEHGGHVEPTAIQ